MNEMPDFTGKLVSLYVRHPPPALQEAFLLEYATFREIGGHLYLHGRIPEYTGVGWVSRLQYGVRWDEVITYFIFDSVEDYDARVRSYRPTLMERLRGR